MNCELLLILDFCMEESNSRQSTLETLKLSLDLDDLCTTRHSSHVNLRMLAYTSLRHQFDPSKTFSSSDRGNVAEANISWLA